MKLETKLRIAKEMYKEKEKKSEKIKEPKQEFTTIL